MKTFVLVVASLMAVNGLPQGFQQQTIDGIDASGTDPFQRTTSTTPTPAPQRTRFPARRPETTDAPATAPSFAPPAPPSFAPPPPPPLPGLPPLSSAEASGIPQFDLSLFQPGKGGGNFDLLFKELFKPGGTSSNNPEVLRGFSDTINDFSQSFLTEVVRSEALARKNFVFSPFSLHVALAMLTSGSTDGSDTQEELLQALGRQRNIQALETKYSEILKEYETLNSTFLFGNRLWISEDKFLSVKQDFVERLERVYSSDYGLLKGSAPEVAVNDWVANRTEGKINKLFDSLDPSLLLVLTNVIYFKDAWTIPFETQTDAARRQFHLMDGQTRANVNTMTRSSQQFRARNVTFPGFIKDKNFTVVSIPYKFGFGERFEMLLVTPAESPRDFRLLQDSLLRASETSEREENIFDVIDRAMKEADEDRSGEEFELTMPEFRVENDMDASKVLNQLGLEGIFELGEFDRMTDLPLRVGEVSHAAIIEVDKEGTVGAAATGIELVPWIGTIDEPTEVTVNKPFLFIIRDKVKNVPLFVGSIVDPVM